jgi:hypothetical protein
MGPIAESNAELAMRRKLEVGVMETVTGGKVSPTTAS